MEFRVRKFIAMGLLLLIKICYYNPTPAEKSRKLNDR